MCASRFQECKVRAAAFWQKAPKKGLGECFEIINDKIRIFWTRAISDSHILYSQPYKDDWNIFGVERCIKEMVVNLENHYNLRNHKIFENASFSVMFGTGYHVICKCHVVTPIKLPRILAGQSSCSL